MNVIEEAFGEGIDLYEVLGLDKKSIITNKDSSIDLAKLRKAYFRKALLYHPDKNQGKHANQEEEKLCKLKFQAISLTYQILSDPEKRELYNETGDIYDNDDADEDFGKKNGKNVWKDYFDNMFGKVTTNDIDAFAQKYKCSMEEQKDVLKQYKEQKGNLHKMMEFVMLSELHDAKRWVEDYILPAIENKTIPNTYHDKLQASLKQINKKLKNQQQKSKPATKNKKATTTTTKKKKSKTTASSPTTEEETETDNDDDDNDVVEVEVDEEEDDSNNMDSKDGNDETTESEEEIQNTKAKKAAAKKKQGASKTNKKRKSKEDNNNMQDLVAQIQARRSGGGGASFLAGLSARYGIQSDEDPEQDPLNDAEFESIQKKLKNNKKNKNNKKRKI